MASLAKSFWCLTLHFYLYFRCALPFHGAFGQGRRPTCFCRHAATAERRRRVYGVVFGKICLGSHAALLFALPLGTFLSYRMQAGRRAAHDGASSLKEEGVLWCWFAKTCLGFHAAFVNCTSGRIAFRQGGTRRSELTEGGGGLIVLVCQNLLAVSRCVCQLHFGSYRIQAGRHTTKRAH